MIWPEYFTLLMLSLLCVLLMRSVSSYFLKQTGISDKDDEQEQVEDEEDQQEEDEEKVSVISCGNILTCTHDSRK